MASQKMELVTATLHPDAYKQQDAFHVSSSGIAFMEVVLQKICRKAPIDPATEGVSLRLLWRERGLDCLACPWSDLTT